MLTNGGEAPAPLAVVSCLEAGAFQGNFDANFAELRDKRLAEKAASDLSSKRSRNSKQIGKHRTEGEDTDPRN